VSAPTATVEGGGVAVDVGADGGGDVAVPVGELSGVRCAATAIGCDGVAHAASRAQAATTTVSERTG